MFMPSLVASYFELQVFKHINQTYNGNKYLLLQAFDNQSLAVLVFSILTCPCCSIYSFSRSRFVEMLFYFVTPSLFLEFQMF